MRLRDPELLASYLDKRNMSQARLARSAGRSRQFIHQLISGQRRTCTDIVGRRIEEALDLVPNTLFDSMKSSGTGQVVVSKGAPEPQAAA